MAAWLQRADLNGSLGSYLNPPFTPEERGIAAIVGWIPEGCIDTNPKAVLHHRTESIEGPL